MTKAEIVWLIVVTSLLAYSFIGGIAGVVIHRALDKREVGYRSNRRDGSIAAGIFWPFAFPVAGGMLTAAYFLSDGRETRRATRHERKMAVLNSEKELKRLEIEQAKVSVQYLEGVGVRAAVPGLFEEAAA